MRSQPRLPPAAFALLVRRAVALLAAGLLAACVPAPAASPAKLSHAGLVVVHADGSVRRACVAFDQPTLTGEELLKRSGLPFTADSGNPMGVLVCSIEGHGCNFPAQPCFCQCASLGGCAYWAYFIQGAQGDWTYANLGARAQLVRDGDVNGWLWLPTTGASAAALPKLRFADLCPPQ